MPSTVPRRSSPGAEWTGRERQILGVAAGDPQLGQARALALACWNSLADHALVAQLGEPGDLVGRTTRRWGDALDVLRSWAPVLGGLRSACSCILCPRAIR